MAPAPKIRVGTQSGKASRASRAPPRRAPRVSAAARPPIRDSVGVPTSKVAASAKSAGRSRPKAMPRKGARTANGRPVTIQ